MKTTRVIIGIPENKEREETRIAETRLIWIPGERPVIVPAVMPMIRARKISTIILINVAVIIYILLNGFIRNIIKLVFVFSNMTNRLTIRKLLTLCSIILLIALFYFGFLFPNFYVISGIIMMIAVLWIFYWVDGFFNLNYRFRHYIVMIVLFTFGMLLNPLFYIFPWYDKFLHFFTALFWCTLIFVPIKKVHIGFFLKILFTISIFLSFMMIHEGGEYIMDKTLDLHFQGVYVSSFSANFDRQSMREVQNPWDDTMQDEILGILGATTFGIINSISYKFRRKEVI